MRKISASKAESGGRLKAKATAPHVQSWPHWRTRRARDRNGRLEPARRSTSRVKNATSAARTPERSSLDSPQKHILNQARGVVPSTAVFQASGAPSAADGPAAPQTRSGEERALSLAGDTSGNQGEVRFNAQLAQHEHTPDGDSTPSTGSLNSLLTGTAHCGSSGRISNDTGLALHIREPPTLWSLSSSSAEDVHAKSPGQEGATLHRSETVDDVLASGAHDPVSAFQWNDMPWMRRALCMVLGPTIVDKQRHQRSATSVFVYAAVAAFAVLVPLSAFSTNSITLTVGGVTAGISIAVILHTLRRYFIVDSFHKVVTSFSARRRRLLCRNVDRAWQYGSCAFVPIVISVSVAYSFFVSDFSALVNCVLCIAMVVGGSVLFAGFAVYITLSYMHRSLFLAYTSHVAAGAAPVLLLHEYAKYVDQLDVTNLFWSGANTSISLAYITSGLSVVLNRIILFDTEQNIMYDLYALYCIGYACILLAIASRVTEACNTAARATHRYFAYRITDVEKACPEDEVLLLHFVHARQVGAHLYGLFVSNSTVTRLLWLLVTSTILIFEVSSSSAR